MSHHETHIQAKFQEYVLMLAYKWYCKKQFLSFWRNKCSVLFSCLGVYNTLSSCLQENWQMWWRYWARSLVGLDGRWFGQDSFPLTKEAISFNATINFNILNSFKLSVLQFLIHYKRIDKSNIEQIRKQSEVKSKLRFLIRLVC